MIIKTELTEEEKTEVKKQYQQCLDIKKNFPHYIKMDALNEKIWLLLDLFGEDFFK